MNNNRYENNINELIEAAKENGFDEKGGNSKCYYVDNIVLLESYFKKEELEVAMEILKELKKESVSVIEVYDYKVASQPDSLGYTKGYIAEERSNGEPLYKRYSTLEDEEKDNYFTYYSERIKDIASEDQNFYDKFISDYIAINESGISVDPSKTDNFFYEKGKQINFIDLTNLSESYINKKYVGKEIIINLINAPYFYTLSNDNDKNIVRNEAENIVTKTITGLINNSRIDFDIIKEVHNAFGNDTDLNIDIEEILRSTSDNSPEINECIKDLKKYEEELAQKEIEEENEW